MSGQDLFFLRKKEYIGREGNCKVYQYGFLDQRLLLALMVTFEALKVDIDLYTAIVMKIEYKNIENREIVIWALPEENAGNMTIKGVLPAFSYCIW